METTTRDEDERTLLRGVGLRVTRPRLAVLTALADHPHADASTVLAAVRRALPGTSHQAVYDCLHALTEAGLVRSLQPAGSPARYEICTGDNHHHLVCRECGAVSDVDCSVGAAPCLEPALDPAALGPQAGGFVVDEAEVIYWGRCARCAAAAAPSPA